jgi:hypothetical protein
MSSSCYRKFIGASCASVAYATSFAREAVIVEANSPHREVFYRDGEREEGRERERERGERGDRGKKGRPTEERPRVGRTRSQRDPGRGVIRKATSYEDALGLISDWSRAITMEASRLLYGTHL